MKYIAHESYSAMIKFYYKDLMENKNSLSDVGFEELKGFVYNSISSLDQEGLRYSKNSINEVKYI